MSDFVYHGQELDLFAKAKAWKAYWASRIRHYLGKDVLEVGAGIGSNTLLLCGKCQSRWVCAEPDARLARRLALALNGSPCGPICEVIKGTIQDVPFEDLFDTILFVDVLEHIRDDRREVLRAVDHLKPQGTLIVLSPAFPWLFSELDEAVGHCRRYTKKRLSEAVPRHLQLLRMEYLDAVGVFASLSNRFLFRRDNPDSTQIRLWDAVMIPCSRILDPLLLHSLGKSVLGVWRKPAEK